MNTQTTGSAIAFTASLDTEDFEPYFEDGHRLGDIHWIRREFKGDEPVLLVGIMRADAGELPEAFEYVWALDETIQILEGRLEIEIEGGPTITLNPGDVGSFKKGGKAIFRARGPYRQFFVMNG